MNWVAWELSGVRGAADLVSATIAVLTELFEAELCSFNQVQPSTYRIARRSRPGTGCDVTAALQAGLLDHPVIVHYLTYVDDVAPLRIGDLMTDAQWFASRTYRDGFRPLGVDRMLAIPVTPRGSGRMAGYAVDRCGSDFRDDALELAEALQPTLIALHRAWGVDLHLDDEREAARERVGLTRRELELLALVARGLTADAIGRAERISPRTVRKHLEHAYAKLDRHDRLTAVDRARQLGLLDAAAGQRSPAER